MQTPEERRAKNIARSKAHYMANKEQYCARAEAWAKRHPEVIKRNGARYRARKKLERALENERRTQVLLSGIHTQKETRPGMGGQDQEKKGY